MHRAALFIAALTTAVVAGMVVVLPAHATPDQTPPAPVPAPSADIDVDVTATATVTVDPHPEPEPEPPSVVQLCAATGIDAVDALLDGVARTDLVEALAPLASLVVPDSDTAQLQADVDLDDVRAALDCDESDPTTTVTPAPTTTTTVPPAPDLPPSALTCAEVVDVAAAQRLLDAGRGNPTLLDANSDGRACNEQVRVRPQGGVDTGGWPAESR